jgi:hypothetical protein
MVAGYHGVRTKGVDMNDPSLTKRPRIEVWREEYAQRPYLRELATLNLCDHHSDLANNLMSVGRDGGPVVRAWDEDTELVLRKFYHVDQELATRVEELQLLHFERKPLFKACIPGVADNWDILPRSLPKGALFRYGNLTWLKAFRDHGRIRWGSASHYNDSAHDEARRDDELERQWSFCGDGFKIVPRQENIGCDLSPIPLSGRVPVSRKASSDYYVLCASSTLEPRLFSDFSADCCAVIRDPTALVHRIRKAMRSWAWPWDCPVRSWEVSLDRIRYFDPFDTGLVQFPPVFSKPIKYLYENEYRFVLFPTEPRVALQEHVEFFVGSLTDIVDLIHVGPVRPWPGHPNSALDAQFAC